MKRLTVIALVLLAVLNGCDDGFEELNVNPNVPSVTDPDHLFANAVYKFHTHYENGVLTDVWGLQVWNQAMADINGLASAGSRYDLAGNALDNSWGLYYSDVLGNVQEAIRLAELQEDGTTRAAIYRIYRAFIFQRVTDLWGDVPYSEALQNGVGTTSTNFTPAYDTQESIYRALLDEVADAVNDLNDNDPNPGSQDWYFQGDTERWRRLGNTLRLRLALRLANSDPVTAQQEAEAAIATGQLMDSPAGGLVFPHADFGRNPFYQLWFSGQGMRHPSQYLVNLLKGDDDPRIGVYMQHSTQSILFGSPDYVGVPSFLLASEIDPDVYNDFTVSLIGESFLMVDRPAAALGFSEACFLRAEAAWRGWGGEDAATWYANGVSSHMDQLLVPTDSADAFLMGPGQFDNTLEQIITEKWKTFIYLNGFEAFTEYRRTGFPMLLDNDNLPIDPASFPQRLPYPPSELSLNGENVRAVGEGINETQSKVWWAK